MEREKALAKNTIIIGFGTFLPKVASIITLPIVTGSLTKAEYGTYDLLLTLISLVLPLATLQIQTAAFRFLVQIREKEEECSRVITNIVFFTIVCSIAPIIVIFFLINNYAGYTRVLICLYFLFDIILQTFQQIARGLGKNTLYSVSTIVNATINMMLIYILINVFDLGLSGVIGAVAVANLCASLFLFYKSGLAQYISFEFISIDLTRQMIAYAWPLIQTIVVPYFSFGLLVLLYWQVIERRFRDSDMSFTESLIGLFSGSYNNLDFNVHLWFLPCFFVTVVLFNILVNLGGRKTAYIVSALMSLIYVILSMPELLWGFNRVFKYIGFYAVGVSLAGRETKIADRKIGTGVTAVVLLTVNFILSLYNLTTGIMWFVTAIIGVAAVILISQFINENRILQYFGRISLIVLCIHGPVYRVVVKIISIPLHMGTDAVREKFLLAMLVMIVTMVICSLAYEIIVRVAPWMIGKKKVKVL